MSAPTFQTMSLEKLVVDKRYQRPLDPKRVQKIVDEFDPRLLGALEVSVHNGKAAIFDGQHRYAALKRLKAASAPCLAHHKLDAKDEATLFVALQRERRNIRPYERFRAMVFSGDPAAREIKRIVEGAGYKIGSHYGPEFEQSGGIGGVVTLERIYRRQGAAGLKATLGLAELWKGEPKSTDAMLLEGLAALFAGYGTRLDGTACRRLADVPARTILRRAMGGDMPGGGSAAARKYVFAELRKIAGVRGRPEKHRKAAA